MNFGFSRKFSGPTCFSAVLLLCASLVCLGQAPQSSQPSPQDQSTEHHGQVIFSRSTDENGHTTTTAGPAAPQSDGQPVKAPVATDDERQAITFTAFDLDVHLELDERTSRCAPSLRCATTASFLSPTSHCKSLHRSPGSIFASRATTRPSLSPRSTPTWTTPANSTKLRLRSRNLSRPARPCNSTPLTPESSNSTQSVSPSLARPTKRPSTPIGT